METPFGAAAGDDDSALADVQELLSDVDNLDNLLHTSEETVLEAVRLRWTRGVRCTQAGPHCWLHLPQVDATVGLLVWVWVCVVVRERAVGRVDHSASCSGPRVLARGLPIPANRVRLRGFVDCSLCRRRCRVAPTRIDPRACTPSRSVCCPSLWPAAARHSSSAVWLCWDTTHLTRTARWTRC